jgi:signal transduction histidine kinase
LRRADGAYRWHLARAVAMRDASGHLARWFGTNTDLDDLKLAQSELQRRAQFDQQLIGIVSHDLRNPLNAIQMATSLLLKRGNLDDQQGKIVARIISSSERATRLIGDFLDFTHARAAGRLPIRPRPANIKEIARQAFDEVRLMHADQPATITHEGAECGVWDPDRIAQLVGNLVGNAFQHNSGDGDVTVKTRGTEDEVTIEVQNDGVPIDPETMARLFEPFERGVKGSTKTGSSVGLGLFIARQIVAAHKGEITVQSTADSGTVFTVRLPRETR